MMPGAAAIQAGQSGVVLSQETARSISTVSIVAWIVVFSSFVWSGFGRFERLAFIVIVAWTLF
jgi:hypothetical protein